MVADQLEAEEFAPAPQFRHEEIERAEADEGDPAERAGMDVADRPVGVVAERVDRLDRHDRPLEGAHAVEADRRHEEAQDRIGPQLVPGAGQRHQAVDHAAPARHPQHHREHHAEALGPVRQGGVVQMVRAGPDVEEDQRPEMDDRQPVGIDRPLRPLRDEVVHDPEEAGGQEETDGIMAVPPLGERILNAGPQDVALRADPRHRHRQVVDDVQHRHGDDEGEEEPVGDVDMRFFPAQDRAAVDQQVDHPDDGEPDIDIPFRLGIFLALGDAHDIAGAGQHDEYLVAPEQEGGERRTAPKRRPAGPLDDIERRCEQRVAAEGEDRRRGVERPQPAEARPGQVQIENREGELQGDDDADQEGGDAPEGRRQRELADHRHVVGRQIGASGRFAGGAAAARPRFRRRCYHRDPCPRPASSRRHRTVPNRMPMTRCIGRS